MEFLDTELGDTSSHKQHQHLASARHSSALVGARGSAKSLWVVAQHDSAWGGADVNDKATRHVPLLRLALQISPAALAIFLSVGSSMLVFPFFTYVRSTGLLGEKLPEVGCPGWGLHVQAVLLDVIRHAAAAASATKVCHQRPPSMVPTSCWILHGSWGDVLASGSHVDAC
jgi:hypothetical protein